MRHPTEGVRRRLLDEPSGVAVTDRRHVHDCAQCLADLDDMRRDAAAVEACLANDSTEDLDLDAAWRRLSMADPVTGRAHPPRSRRTARLIRRPSAAVAAFALALGAAGTAAANDWLPIFRAEQVAPLSIGTGDLVALPDLSAYGTLDLTGEPEVHEVPTAAAAESETGLELPEVYDLPGGVAGIPVYSVGAKLSATFTFSAERAGRAVTRTGQRLPPVPPGLDGSSVRLDAGPGLAEIWKSSSGAPALLVGRAVAPTAFSSGVRFETVRDYLLSLPGLPDKIADQLRTFAADGSTLPLPVPADHVVTTTADVKGKQATVLATRDHLLSAVVWVDHGTVTVVAGVFGTDELLDVARALG
jgi:hypothetical protein